MGAPWFKRRTGASKRIENDRLLVHRVEDQLKHDPNRLYSWMEIEIPASRAAERCYTGIGLDVRTGTCKTHLAIARACIRGGSSGASSTSLISSMVCPWRISLHRSWHLHRFSRQFERRHTWRATPPDRELRPLRRQLSLRHVRRGSCRNEILKIRPMGQPIGPKHDRADVRTF